MKNHPVLFSIFIIVLIVVVISGAILALVYFTTDRMSSVQFGDRIALIEIQGTMKDGGRVTSILHNYSKQKRVKAIIVRINSPGGGVAAAQEIYREIERVRKKKPVVAFLGGVAASGGYYVASAANRVVASPGTLTGSIGVIMEFANLEDLLKKIGVSAQVIKSGRYKDIGSPTRRMTGADQQLINELVMEVHNQFLNDVAKGRNMDPEKVRAIADGRILTGSQAKELGLVDELGNFQDAVNVAKQLAHIKGEVKLVRPREKVPSIWDYVLRSTIEILVEELGFHTVSLNAVP